MQYDYAWYKIDNLPPLNIKILLKYYDGSVFHGIMNENPSKKYREKNWQYIFSIEENPYTFLLVEHIYEWSYGT